MPIKCNEHYVDLLSTGQFAIELTRISKQQLKSTEELKTNTAKPIRAMDGQNWRRLKRVAQAQI